MYIYTYVHLYSLTNKLQTGAAIHIVNWNFASFNHRASLRLGGGILIQTTPLYWTTLWRARTRNMLDP